MKGGGKGAGSGAATTTALLLALLVAAASLLQAEARRLGAAPVSTELSGPHTNPCTYDPVNPGGSCRGPSQQHATAQAEAVAVAVSPPPPLVSAGKASSGPNGCTNNPNDTKGKKCFSPLNTP